MAKAQYLVIDGCIQDGDTITLKGELYSPASKELAATLVAQGRIAVIVDPAAQQSLELGDNSGNSKKAETGKEKESPVQASLSPDETSGAGA